MQAPCALRVTLQAEGDEADSDRLVVTIQWDGQWHDGALEMAQYMRVSAT
jgi:hypothetical protein